MTLPPLHNPRKYAGLYVFNFGDHASIGYTAEEIAILFDSGRFPDGEAYRIHRAHDDGTLELEQVSRASLEREQGLLFYRQSVREARRDFDLLARLAEHDPPPCPLSAELVKIQSAGAGYLTALIYASECSRQISEWLHGIKFEGGDFVRGGGVELSCYRGASPVTIDSRRWGGSRGASRSADQVLATIDLAVQR